MIQIRIAPAMELYTPFTRMSRLTDVHFIPFHGRYLIYRPLKRLAFIGNLALVNYLRARVAAPAETPVLPEVEMLAEKTGFWEPAVPPEAGLVENLRPTMAVLLMTNRCNLACTYCYAAAGSKAPIDMSWPMARAVIDAAVENARNNGDARFGLSFHGGGEPTLNWSVLRRAVSYSRALPLSCEVSLASNGVWSSRTTDFICRNIDSVTLSFDGVRSVQDSQRPCRSRRSSFDAVLRSIKALDAAGVRYGIRMTVTPAAIDRLPESVEFLRHETGVRAIQIEATFTVQRGVYADLSKEDGARFVDAFLQAARIAADYDVFVAYSAARPWVIAHAFCLASTQSLIATPEGRLVACFEVAGDGHPYADEFSIGRVTPNGIELDRAAYKRFQKRQETRRTLCRECFCYWHCCGDCASRAMVSTAPNSVRCHINREITKAIIAGSIEREGGVWMWREPVP
jgi:uncharacterized protein